MGNLIGGALFYLQKGSACPLIARKPVWEMLPDMLLGCTLLPLPVSMDIRGSQEIHPLDGPAWSLFFEYIANFLYALGLRKLSKTVLSTFVFLAALLLLQPAVSGHRGDLIGGWSVDPTRLHVGFSLLLFLFFGGIVLNRFGARFQLKSTFGISSVLLIVALSLPRFCGTQHHWINGLYEAFCVIILFPIIVAIGASEKRVDGSSIRVARFFGHLSYPLYITHYPLIYIYTSWVVTSTPTGFQGALPALLLAAAAISIAFVCFKPYDEPVRKWLSKRLLAIPAEPAMPDPGEKMMIRYCTVLLPFVLSPLLFGQTAVREDAAHRQWYIDAGRQTYAIGVNEEEMLQSLYWGPKLAANAQLPVAKMHDARASFDPPIGNTPLEYPAWGAGLFTEAALKANSSNGDRTLLLKYDSAKVTGSNELEIVLKDATEPLRVHLYYHAYPEGVIARWSRLENTGKEPFGIEQAASATWNLPQGTGYQRSWLTGMWGAEWQLHTEPMQTGTAVLESRKGSTSHQNNPWFAIGKTAETTEESGPVWFGELGWSGSWRMTVEQTALQLVRVTGGYNPFDFHWVLKAGETLETPKFYAGYTEGGNGEASRIEHRFQTDEILPMRTATTPPKPRPIIFNSWEATEMTFTDQTQIALAEKAARLGVERFVIDDGWFGQRNDDHRGLGDWYLNKQKFPNGLKPVIEKVHSLGMDFGIWVEPEMVNPDSDLYRQHPDWAMQFPNRQHTEQRQQLLLNLARPDVKEWMFNWLDKLVSENDIAFLKWDYNRNWSEPGWNTAPGSSVDLPNTDEEKEIYVRYVENLYDVLGRLRKKHPKLEIESCSGGGGRVDLGILQLTDEVWPSDNTDALDRLSMQNGYTHAYSPQTMAAWVTDVPNLDGRATPLQYRFLVAMQGALGIGNNLNKWTNEDFALGAKLTALYKTIRTTVQQGSLYRLTQPLGGDQNNEEGASQVEYVARDDSQAVLLAYLHSMRYQLGYPTVRLRGLDPTAMYRVKALDAEKYTGEQTVSGSVLMGAGIQLRLSGDYDSTALVLERIGR